MSRVGSGNEIIVKPRSNVYTALAAAGAIAVAVGLAALLIRANSLGISFK